MKVTYDLKLRIKSSHQGDSNDAGGLNECDGNIQIRMQCPLYSAVPYTQTSTVASWRTNHVLLVLLMTKPIKIIYATINNQCMQFEQRSIIVIPFKILLQKFLLVPYNKAQGRSLHLSWHSSLLRTYIPYIPTF